MLVGRRFAATIVLIEGRAIFDRTEVTAGAAKFSVVGYLFVDSVPEGVLPAGANDAGVAKARTDEVRVDKMYKKEMEQ
jgi:hypothetical protein